MPAVLPVILLFVCRIMLICPSAGKHPTCSVHLVAACLLPVQQQMCTCAGLQVLEITQEQGQSVVRIIDAGMLSILVPCCLQ